MAEIVEHEQCLHGGHCDVFVKLDLPFHTFEVLQAWAKLLNHTTRWLFPKWSCQKFCQNEVAEWGQKQTKLPLGKQTCLVRETCRPLYWQEQGVWGCMGGVGWFKVKLIRTWRKRKCLRVSRRSRHGFPGFVYICIWAKHFTLRQNTFYSLR